MKDKNMSQEEIDKIIAERLMTPTYLEALMQESSFMQEHIQVIPIGFNEDIDITLDPIYSPQWSESAWVTKTTKEEE